MKSKVKIVTNTPGAAPKPEMMKKNVEVKIPGEQTKQKLSKIAAGAAIKGTSYKGYS
jgi:hypothetical protein|tara:strand:- start:18 stop:188 length:171 start_codon:yes stop_codon:yes gene_type:complete